MPSFPEFLARHVWMDDAGGTPFHPWGWQAELAAVVPRVRQLLILKARQIGVTWFLGGYGLHTAMHAGAKVLLFSQGEREAKAFKAKTQFIHDHLSVDLQRQEVRWNQLVLAFPDLQSYLEAFPSTQNAARGTSSARLAIFDEFAFHQCALPAMAAVAPSVESNPDGQIIVVSTANGMGNAFHLQWQAATAQRGWIEPELIGGVWRFGDRLERAADALGPRDWLALFLPYYIRPGRDEAWYEREREAVQYRVRRNLFHQEFPKQVEEAFVQTGRPVFAIEDLRRQEAFFREPLPMTEWPQAFQDPVAAFGEQYTGTVFRPDVLRVFELPVEGHVYVGGADVAEGLEHGDFSDLSVLDIDAKGAPREVLSLHGHWAPDEFAALIDVVARAYPGVYGIERNNHGLTVLTVCDRTYQTPGLYREVAVFDPRTGRELVPAKLGWVTSSVTKPIMIDELEQAIRLNGVRFSDALALPELVAYQHRGDRQTGAPEGSFDDRVISRAIAWQVRQRRGEVLVFY